MYNPITSVKISMAYGAEHQIQWILDPAFPETIEYFIPQVSGAIDFSELLYELPSTTDCFAVDDTHIKQSLARDMYVRIKTHTVDGKDYFTKPYVVYGSRVSRRQFVQARDIQRKELLRMRYGTGREMYLLKRKIYQSSEPAPGVDPVTGVPLTNQGTSLGSSNKHAYYTPIKLWVSFEESEMTRKQASGGLGIEDVRVQELRAIGFPIIETYDVLVDPDNDERYFVKSKQEYYFPGSDLCLAQNLNTQFIPNTDPIYKVPVNKE